MLINFVLIIIHFYWDQVFVLPRKIIDDVDRICRAFLWSGEFYNGKAGYVNIQEVWVWETLVCGMLLQWGNMGRLLQRRNLWLKWVSEVYVQFRLRREYNAQ